MDTYREHLALMDQIIKKRAEASGYYLTKSKQQGDRASQEANEIERRLKQMITPQVREEIREKRRQREQELEQCRKEYETEKEKARKVAQLPRDAYRKMSKIFTGIMWISGAVSVLAICVSLFHWLMIGLDSLEPSWPAAERAGYISTAVKLLYVSAAAAAVSIASYYCQRPFSQKYETDLRKYDSAFADANHWAVKIADLEEEIGRLRSLMSIGR